MEQEIMVAKIPGHSLSERNDFLICKTILPWFEIALKCRFQKPINCDDPSTPSDRNIDLLAKSKSIDLAIEHTQIGPFREFEAIAPLMRRLNESIDSCECLLLDRERVEIGLPFGWWSQFGSKRKVVTLTNALCGLLPKITEQLRSLPPNRTGSHYTEDVEGLSVHLSLIRNWSTKKFVVTTLCDREEVEIHRLDRLVGQLRKKLPKLSKWQEDGAITVLLVEDPDISISNADLVVAALKKAINGLPIPDFICYVDAGPGNEWVMLPVFQSGEWDTNHWTEMNEPRFWEFRRP